MRIQHALSFSLVVAALVVTASGCSAKSDFEKICNAEKLSGVDGNAALDPSQKAVTIAKYISDNIHSSEAKKAFSAIAGVDPKQRGELLKEAAHEGGYDGPCPLADAK